MINIDNIMPIDEFRLLEPFDFNNVYELGNKKNKKGTYKSLFQRQKIDHVSIDINGLDGALPLDLSTILDMPSRDIVTNYGTSEHIYEQSTVFLNIHNLSHHRMVHMIPRVNNSPHHGYWHVDFDFFIELAALNNYEIEQLFITNEYPIENMCCSYRKTNNADFQWSDNLPMQWQPNGK